MKETKAKGAVLVLGIIGMITCWFAIVIGIIFGIAGLVYAIKALCSGLPKKNVVYVGLVLSVLSIIFSFVMIAVRNSSDDAEGNSASITSEEVAEDNTEGDSASPSIVSIYATYDGKTEDGTEISMDSWQSLSIDVTAVYDDGSEDSVSGWDIENPGTLQAGETSTFTITYEGFSCALDITCDSEEDAYVYVGESYDKKGLTISFVDYNSYYTPPDWYEPDAGNKYISASFSVTNNSDTDKTIYTGDFDCYVDNVMYDDTLLSDFEYEELSPGRSVDFTLVYEVPENGSSIEIEFSNSLLTSGADAIFKLQ